MDRKAFSLEGRRPQGFQRVQNPLFFWRLELLAVGLRADATGLLGFSRLENAEKRICAEELRRRR